MTERDVFIDALQKEDAAERQNYLDKACAGQPELRRQVENLLRLHEGAGSFLEKPAASSAATGAFQDATGQASSPETPGAIGPYKLLEQIGEGGMGTVWMAQQTEPVKRLVAVKLIKAGMDSKQVIARFEAERQALALMDHPNIARVLEAGTTGAGRPYFVMDLVKGVPITRYCDEHHLTPRQRLELFAPVCQAVQHAHQKGIIHRDLKPSNVLVALYDGKPVPKVIDFGVAKAVGQPLTEQTLVTGFGAIVGTLEYMSPEQAEVNQLDIDTRSDIYSLGVLLYELLTGSPPFSRKELLEKAGMLEMLRVIREQEPSKPSTKLSTAAGLPSLAANRGTDPAKLTKLVRGELDWIVMKALEKDRNRRYETANGFAADVQRYFWNDETVQACPPSAGYRLRKFARRNKGGLAVAALVLFFLVLLGSGAGWAVRDRSARDAELARQQADRQAKFAGQVELILAEADQLEGEQKWPEALAAVRRAEAILSGGEVDAATAERVRDRLRGLELIDRLERVRMAAATWVNDTRDTAGTDQEYTRAFREYGVDVDALPVETAVGRLKARPALVIPVAAALDDWAEVRWVAQGGRGDDAAAKRLVWVARGIDPEPLRDRVRAAWRRQDAEVADELRRAAESIDVRAEHPATLVMLHTKLLQVKHLDHAVRLLRDAQLAHPGDFRINFELAYLLSDQKDYEGAIRFYTAAVSIRPRATAALSNLGSVLRALKKPDEAIAAFRRSLELEPQSAHTHWHLGEVLREQGKLDEANAAFDKAVELARKAVELDLKSAGTYFRLGRLLRDRGRPADAAAAFRKALEIDPTSAVVHNFLGSVLLDLKKPDEAAATLRKSLKINPTSALAHNLLGNALLDLKKPDEAAAAYRKAVELDPKSATAYSNLGFALLDLKKRDEAAAVLRKAAELDPKSYRTYINLGSALLGLKKPDEAAAAYLKAVELAPKSANAYISLGSALHGQKKLDEAAAAYRKAAELDPTEGAARAYISLGALLREQGKPDEAVVAFRKAIEVNQPSANVNAHVNLAATLAQQNRLDEAVAAYQKVIELERNSPRSHNAIAWILATRPEAHLRDSKRAVALARRAVELKPEEGDYWNTLGAAHYRAGQWTESIAALQKSMKLRKGGDGDDWFFLAMTHWQLGEKEKAREWFDKGVEWMERKNVKSGVTPRLRAEAAELLGIEKKESKARKEDPEKKRN